MYKPALQELLKEKMARSKKYGIYYATYRGDEPIHRLVVNGGTHGNELAGPLAIAKLLSEGWQYDKLEVLFIIQDPIGYKEEGYGFVGVDGNESMWPPLWSYHMNRERYWAFYDENSTWGNMHEYPERHRFMRHLIGSHQPTFAVGLHETIRSENIRDEFWSGAGNLLIETWPITPSEMAYAADWVGSPSGSLVDWIWKVLFEWLRDMFGIRRWRMLRRGLMKNPHYQLTTEIADRYTDMGGHLTHNKWIRYLEAQQDIVIGVGRILHNPVSMMSEWKTFTDYCATNFGCPGVTTETFPCGEVGMRGLDDRVQEQYLYLKAALEVLNENN